MNTITRRSLVASTTVTLALPAISRQARAAEITLKYANNASVDHPVNIRAAQIAERVKADTNGRVEIQIFPNSQLGGDTDTISQLRSGGIDMLTLSGLILSILVPAASINGIGFAFPDYATVWKAMDGKLGEYVRDQIAKSGLIAMDRMWDNGFRQMTTSTKPIRTQSDLVGFKIRVPVSPLWTSMFKALGAAPTGINFAEVYSALQTHIVDGQEQPLVVIDTSKLYEVQKYCSLTNHMWGWLLVAGEPAQLGRHPGGPARDNRQAHQPERLGRTERRGDPERELADRAGAQGADVQQGRPSLVRRAAEKSWLLRRMEKQVW